MENLSNCPVGSVTIGEKSLDLCAKRGCKLEQDFRSQAQVGGTDINGENNGPFWSHKAWDNFCNRNVALTEEDMCLMGQATLDLIVRITFQKLLAEPPEITNNFTPLE